MFFNPKREIFSATFTAQSATGSGGRISSSPP